MTTHPPLAPVGWSAHAGRWTCWLLALTGGFGNVPSATAQFRPVALQDATLLTGTGQTIPHGTLIFQDGKISAVGADVKPSFLARKLSATGKYVTPGLIDAASTLALRLQPGANLATAQARDTFDRYAEDEIRAAWRDGVTAAFIPARTGSGVGGLGAVIRLRAGTDPDEIVLRKDAALCAAIGVEGRPGPLARVKVAEELRRRLQTAREYRESWEDYAESLKEYEQKLAERAKKEAGNKDKNAGQIEAGGDKDGDAGKAEKKEEPKDEPKKPAEPAKDRSAELLLRVLDGELPLRVEAHDPADILNVLDLAEEFNLALVLEGAAGAHLVADQIAKLAVPVVLSAPPAPLEYVAGRERYARPDDAAVLQKAGVRVYLGSGALPGADASPRLVLRAALAAGNGFGAAVALEALTAGAARLLGVEQEIGKLEPGLKADLVIWSDHPFAPGTRVEQVYIDGREVYRADGKAEESDE